MPHQCVRCGTLYEDASSEILKGCKCGARLFFYIKNEEIAKAKALTVNLSAPERKQIEEDISEIIEGKMDPSLPVFLDIESIRILKPGQYELDLVQLFKGKPLIYKLEDGKYIIDLVSTFKAKEL